MSRAAPASTPASPSSYRIPHAVDVHCHLLHGLDDGPKTLDESLELARALVADGIGTVAATVHWTPQVYTASRQAVLERAVELDEALHLHGIALKIIPVHEVRLDLGMFERLQDEDLLFLNRSNDFHLMLLEFPDGSVPIGSGLLIRRLIERQIQPIIVHPERNKGLMAEPDLLQPFLEMGCLTQITAGALVGEFGERARTTALHFLDNDWVDVVATDAHNLKGRPPRMRAAYGMLAEYGGEAFARKLTCEAPRALLGQKAERRKTVRTAPVLA